MAPFEPERVLPRLDEFLHERLADPPSGSYSYEVMTDPVLAQRKLMEEAFEVCLELGETEVDAARLSEEAADLVFHLLCALIGAGVRWTDVESVLSARHGGAG